jgi:acyl-CoA thioester hydrolase
MCRHSRSSPAPFPYLKPNPARLDLKIYPHTVDIQARFADIDPQWHLNNVRIAEFYQEGRISFNSAVAEELNIEHQRDWRVLAVRQSIDYLGQVRWPSLICIGVGVSHLGNTSFSLGLAMFQDARCVGISDAVLVNAASKGPARIPDALREVLTRRMLPQAAQP